MIRWGILGAGKIAGKFCHDLLLVADAQITAVGSRSVDKARQFGKKYNIPQCYGSYEELAASDEVDIIYIATPHNFHHDHSMLCLNNKKHVLCEKPLGINADQVRDMINCAKLNEVFFMEAIWTAYLPAMRKVKSLIEDNAIGSVTVIQADFGFNAPHISDGRLYSPDLAGGALLDIGIYPLFIAHYLKGIPDNIQAMSTMTETGVDGSTMVNLKWKDGTVSSQHSTILADTATEAHIYGSKGHIHMHRRWHETKKISLYQGGNLVETWDYGDPCLGYKYEIEECHQCIKNNRTESEIISHEFSLGLSQSMDEIRRQIGLYYPFEKSL